MDRVGLEDGGAEVGDIGTSEERRIRLRVERRQEACLTWISAKEARALAALLLKHADRAEGK